VWTRCLLEIFEWKRGYEAFLSPGITACAVPYVFTTAQSMATGLFSMRLSLWGLGTHVYEALALGMLAATGGAESYDGMEQGSAAHLEAVTTPLDQE